MVGDDPEMLVSDLQNQFPNAAIEVNENCDAGLVAKVVDLIERPAQALDLPTDFQMRVWDALQKVPAGSTGELHLFSRTNRRDCSYSSDRSASWVGVSID